MIDYQKIREREVQRINEENQRKHQELDLYRERVKACMHQKKKCPTLRQTWGGMMK